MGFTVTAALFGLPSVVWYVTIKGSYTIDKNAPDIYHITYTTYYSVGANQPTIKQDVRFLVLQQPAAHAAAWPANLYTAIYDDIKNTLGDLAYTDD